MSPVKEFPHGECRHERVTMMAGNWMSTIKILGSSVGQRGRRVGETLLLSKVMGRGK